MSHYCWYIGILLAEIVTSRIILKQFMRVTEGPLTDAAERQLLWLVIIHVTFVVSGLLLYFEPARPVPSVILRARPHSDLCTQQT
jgi:hypothetical protein